MLQSKPVTDFQNAISLGHYAEADRLLGDVQKEVEEHWHASGVEERRSLAVQTFALLDWARKSVLTGRAQAQRTLTEISRHHAYLENTSRPERED